MTKLHILAIAAHPDDIELSCSGTLIKHVKMGQAVGILDLTQGELGTRGSKELRHQEAQNAAQIMGISIRENALMRDGFFENNEQHQLKIITYLRTYQPEIVLANAPDDRHPDHGRASKLTTDACFLSGLSKIETFNPSGEKQKPWRPKRVFHYIQDRELKPDFITDISATFTTKIEAIKAYQSQFFNPNSTESLTYISTPDFLEQLRYRDALMGKKIGTNFGEGFISVNTIGIENLDQLIYPEIG